MSSPDLTPGPVARRYFRYTYHPLRSRVDFVRWLVTVPFRSRLGARAISEHSSGPVPPRWKQDFKGRRTLIIGSGPSLDRVDNTLFDQFETFVYINFALSRAAGREREYFFTTDSGPIRQFIDAKSVEPFETLGQEKCIFAPIFLDSWQGFTDKGRALVTWLGFDRAGWKLMAPGRGRFSPPIILRYHPRQPDWSKFRLPEPGRRIPVLDHTSALSAAIFAAAQGSNEIGLIGCDFSTGRAASVDSSQADPGDSFSQAADEFRNMTDALAQCGIVVTNYSWTV